MADKIQKENMLKVGTMLSNGKYRIDEYLASGGFGNTYVATNMTFDEKIAIKELFIKGVCGRRAENSEISVSLNENKRAFNAQQEKFRKEAKRLRKLDNSHIVKVHDLFDENGTSYYVMDFVEGESLSARMKRTKQPMSESELYIVLPQVLDALECVHNEGIWHLDLKPANIMIDAKGNVQLIDFGASKQLKNANGDSLSTSSVMAYTHGYAPSEQIEQNIEKFGPWTDLYALGATIFNMLTMQQPPSPSDIDEDSHAALKLPQNISRKTTKLILWLMKPNRKMRPQNVTDVRQFLLEYSESKDVETGPESNLSYEADSELESNPGQKPEQISDSKQMIEDDHTEIKQKKKPEHEPKPKPKSKPKFPYPYKKTMTVAAAVALVCIGGGMFGVKGCNNPESIAIDTFAVKSVTAQLITITSGPENMRQYKYTGELVDTVGALPNAKGRAEFDKYGNIPASVYEGLFVDGVCEDNTGEATMTFTSGDKYIGTFKGGYYSKGKYILSDKSYFEGTFKNGSPYNGSWYTSNGSFDGKVVNGVDQ